MLPIESNKQRKKKRTFVYVVDDLDGAVFCKGIYDDFYVAYGHLMMDIEEFRDSYKSEGDVFQVSELMDMDCDGGVMVQVQYRANCWDESHTGTDNYMLLFLDEYEEVEEKA